MPIGDRSTAALELPPGIALPYYVDPESAHMVTRKPTKITSQACQDIITNPVELLLTYMVQFSTSAVVLNRWLEFSFTSLNGIISLQLVAGGPQTASTTGNYIWSPAYSTVNSMSPGGLATITFGSFSPLPIFIMYAGDVVAANTIHSDVGDSIGGMYWTSIAFDTKPDISQEEIRASIDPSLLSSGS